jgi:hypothetical protein
MVGIIAWHGRQAGFGPALRACGVDPAATLLLLLSDGALRLSGP